MTAPQAPFESIVFDVDGTLTDTEEAWDVVRRRLAAEDGVPWPEAATTAMMGMSTPEWSRYLSETVGLHGTTEECARRTIDAMHQLYLDNQVDLLPGARAAVRRMATLAPLGIASSSPVVLIQAAIDEMGIGDLVKAWVSTEQVERGKPAPDGYLRCCELLGADPGRSLAIEDSANGIRSALAAGMTVVCVPPAFHPPAAEVLDECAAVLTSLDDLTVELVQGLA